LTCEGQKVVGPSLMAPISKTVKGINEDITHKNTFPPSKSYKVVLNMV